MPCPRQTEFTAFLKAHFTAVRTAEQWQAWLAAIRPHLYFTDVSGYKFLVVPEGYTMD